MSAHDVIASLVDEETAARIHAALNESHYLRERPWPPIPYPDDRAHQARWTIQRAFTNARWTTGDDHEGFIAAADALLAEGWQPPVTLNGKPRDALFEETYRDLQRELTTPPEGWFVFGTHIDIPGPLEFWGNEAGLPIWERPITEETS